MSGRHYRQPPGLGPHRHRQQQQLTGKEGKYDKTDQAGLGGSGEALLGQLGTSTTSPDNPFLPLTSQEYITLKRFQGEKGLPDRFRKLPGRSSAHENSLYAPINPPPTNPTFRTSSRLVIVLLPHILLFTRLIPPPEAA